jgi:hypothetical protein
VGIGQAEKDIKIAALGQEVRCNLCSRLQTAATEPE